MSEERLRELRAGAALAVVPSRYAEIFPLAAAEAMAAALPTVAFRTGGLEGFVPEDAEVEVGAFGVMGGVDHGGEGPGAPGAPRIRITGVAVMGGIEVKRAPARQSPKGESPKGELPSSG